ncbi:hypothetical protein SAMN05216417_12436 [Nitrosospira multiformis]|uniref:Uncharacterized protein n=2 Tax=Nitrosospira multiformis TaxID=1231 RepID=A0A1I7IRI7_9PROT|nr:hypothetical protein SAMN05216417_12436 [Nitrosospira multiformis]
MKYVKPKLHDRIARFLNIPVRIPSLKKSGHDLCTRVDGHFLHVRSKRTKLVLSPEALGTAFLLPTVATSRRLVGDSCDPVWLENTQRILDHVNEWWEWGSIRPSFAASNPGQPSRGIGLAFSLGVDSFYSCFFADPPPDLLILAAGFDVPVERKDILTPMCNSLATVAEVSGKDWTMIETNLRRHRLFRRLSWEASHGAAVAFLGHLLQEHIGSLLISSSYDQEHLGPWGSHPDLDPCWSSSRLSIRSMGHEVSRSEKIRRLVNHPVARPLMKDYLRVCWENPSSLGNCGYCHKCVLLRMTLQWHAPDLKLRTLPEDIPLVQAIEALPLITNNLSLNFRRELVGHLDRPIDRALQKLIRRSEESIQQAGD